MNLPEAFIHSLEGDFGKTVAKAFIESFEEEAVTAVRRNVSKLSRQDFEEHFSSASPEAVPWCEEGLYLAERPNFTLDPWLHAGGYYVQDASSMAVVAAFRAVAEGSGLKVLDLCAAPGGKTTAISSILSSFDLLVANEVIRSRVTVLAENVTKWGRANVVVTNNSAGDFSAMKSYFDVILADVPCSGEGMFRKDARAVEEWSEDNVRLCASRQRKIVADVWDSLKEGGYLFYSTCTFNSEENDENVQWIENELGAERVSLDLFKFPESPIKTETGFQFIPGTTRGEGFFFAVLRKTSAAGAMKRPKAKASSRIKCEWIKNGFEAVAVKTSAGDMIKAYPDGLKDDILLIENNLRCVMSGTLAAALKGRDIVPEPALALSEVLADNAFSQLSLSVEEALDYLRLQPIAPQGMERGYILVDYRGARLGFLKNLGNRTNNLFPSSWRIRTRNN